MENRLTRTIYNSSPIFLQNIFLSILGYQNKKRRFNEVFYRKLDFLKESQWFSRTELENYQDAIFVKLIEHAYDTVPYYRNSMKKLGLAPRDVKSKEELKLPILTKEAVSSNYHNLISCSFKDLISGHTSGTTGTSLRLVYTGEAFENEYSVVWRMRNWFGVNIQDECATFGGRLIVPELQKKPPFWRHNCIGKQTLFSLYHITLDNLAYYVEELRRKKFVYYQGYPSSIFLIASYINEQGISFDNPPKVIFTSSETLFEYQRKTIEEAFKTKVYDRYGNSEFCCSIVQCEQGNYHVDMEFGIVEIVPLEETSDYIKGKLICTGFANWAMPFIRYDIGDVITVSKEKCPCGRESTVVKQIDGRIEDYIVTADSKRIGRMDHIFKDMVNIKESQIIQDDIKSIKVNIVKRDGYTQKDEKQLMKEFHQRLGNQTDIEFVYVKEIPREANGKFRAVISKIPRSKIRQNMDIQDT